jgi:hypothetical protein
MIYKRGGWHWTDFTENGRRYRRPLKTRNWQEARTEERKIIERAGAGNLADSAAAQAIVRGRSALFGRQNGSLLSQDP